MVGLGTQNLNDMGEHKLKKANKSSDNNWKLALTILKYIVTALLGYFGGNAVM